jgi:hypothetical protein
MPPCEQKPRQTIDWLALAALVWALGFGAIYAEMVVRVKAPRLARAVSTWIAGGSASGPWRLN